MEVDRHQQGVVVEHLLEMRHEPAVIDRVAVETAAELIVEAAARHLLQGEFGHREGGALAGAEELAQEEIERHPRWELGGRAEATLIAVEPIGEAGRRLVEDRQIERAVALTDLEP